MHSSISHFSSYLDDLEVNSFVSLFSTDWVDVANDLLSKCHINLRLRKLTDCDANVFIALYEAIFGEKVPGNKLLMNHSPQHYWVIK